MTPTLLGIRPPPPRAGSRSRLLAATGVMALQLLGAACSPAPTENSAAQQPAKAEPAKTEAAKTTETQGTGPVVARVNGVEMRQSDLTMAEEDIGTQLPPMAPDAKRDYLITYVADLMLLAQAAEAKKLDETDAFRQQIAFARRKLLMDKLLEAQAASSVSDAAMRKVYDDATSQMSAEQEVRARHILVESEDEAKAVESELKQGADFAELAKQKSKDPGAAAEGGDLGYFTKEQMVPEFAEAAFKLDKGQLSEPVKSPFGWHIIKVEDKRTRPLPEFEQVKSQIEVFVKRKAQAEYVSSLRQAAKIERLDAKPEGDAAKSPAEKPAPDAPAAKSEPEKK